MKRIVVLGPGCPNCETLAKNVRQAADELGIDYELEKLTDIKQFSKFGLMMTPGLVVDGQLMTQGKVPRLEELKSILG